MHALGFLRHGVLDLISAAAFLAIWLLRDQFEYETLRSLLFWPLVFEMYVAVALFIAGMAAGMRRAPARVIWLVAIIAGCLFGAWLTSANAGTPHVWTIAFWLLLARLWPPRGLKPPDRGYLQWLQTSAGYSGLLWGAGFVLTMVLVMIVPAVQTELLSDGSIRSTSPAWIFPLVCTPYFIAEAMLRARQRSRED